MSFEYTGLNKCFNCGGGWLLEDIDMKGNCRDCQKAGRRKRLAEAIAKRPPLTNVQKLKNLEKFMREKD